MTNLVLRSFKRMTKDENGSAVTEYAIVMGLVIIAAIAIVAQFGTRVLARWNSVNEQLDGRKPPAPIR